MKSQVNSISIIQHHELGIGNNGELIVMLYEDQKFFHYMTTGTPKQPTLLIMGPKTWNSIPNKKTFVKGRDIMVISRTNHLTIMEEYVNLGIYGANSATMALEWAKHHYPEIWVCGGEPIYEILLRECDKLYLTEVEGALPADRFFPKFTDTFHFKKELHQGASVNRAPGANLVLTPYKINVYERNKS